MPPRMLVSNTPVQDYTARYGCWVKREDMSCPPPGPQFSKARGVYRRVASRPEIIIGALDTYHSQAGHAVARACQVLGKQCINYYPEFKNEPGPRQPQLRAQALGAELYGLKATRSSILHHQARKLCVARGGYMMPNALKLEESVEETAAEVSNCLSFNFATVIVPASSGTIAAGVVAGFYGQGQTPLVVIHLGYSRAAKDVITYVNRMSGYSPRLQVIDEEYEYKDVARIGPTPPWPCNRYYDLKAFRWWLANVKRHKHALFWNIG